MLHQMGPRASRHPHDLDIALTEFMDDDARKSMSIQVQAGTQSLIATLGVWVNMDAESCQRGPQVRGSHFVVRLADLPTIGDVKLALEEGPWGLRKNEYDIWAPDMYGRGPFGEMCADNKLVQDCAFWGSPCSLTVLSRQINEVAAVPGAVSRQSKELEGIPEHRAIAKIQGTGCLRGKYAKVNFPKNILIRRVVECAKQMMGLNNFNPRFRVRVYLEWGRLLLNLSVSRGIEDWEMSRFLNPSGTGCDDATANLGIGKTFQIRNGGPERLIQHSRRGRFGTGQGRKLPMLTKYNSHLHLPVSMSGGFGRRGNALADASQVQC